MRSGSRADREGRACNTHPAYRTRWLARSARTGFRSCFVSRARCRQAAEGRSHAQNIAEHALGPINIEAVGAAAGLHPNYAMTVFKKAVGMTMHQALTGHRLDTVQSLLISSERPIASVAFENAFGSLSRFYSAFESRFEITPSKCRDGFVSSLRS